MTPTPRTAGPEPADIARYVLDSNRYMTLGTTEADGRPRLSPVYYAHDRYSVLYWISSPEARHSRNIVSRPDVSIVVYDSLAAIGKAQAVYLNAVAERVPEHELDQCAEVACRPRFPEQQPFPLDELRPPAMLRLYRARVGEHAIHIAGSHPVLGRGTDYRLTVKL